MKKIYIAIALLFANNIHSAAHSQWDLDEALFTAVQECDLQKAKRLLAAGADVNASIYDPMTGELLLNVLFKATSEGCLEIVALLLNNGADAKIRNYLGLNALEDAFIFYKEPHKIPAITGRLIKAGVDLITQEGNYQSSPLHTLIDMTNSPNRLNIMTHSSNRRYIENKYALPAAFQLFMAGAKADLHDEKGRTSLMLAKEINNYDMAALLEMYPGRNLQERIIFSIAKMFYSDDPRIRAAGEQQLKQLQETAFAYENPDLMRLLYLIIGKGVVCTNRFKQEIQ